MESIYTFSTTSKNEFEKKLYMLNRIANKCNIEIIHINNISSKWNFTKEILEKSLNSDIANYIKQYVNFKMNGIEVRWIIDNSDTTFPFECRGCCKFLKIKLKYNFSNTLFTVSLIKDKYCTSCKII